MQAITAPKDVLSSLPAEEERRQVCPSSFSSQQVSESLAGSLARDLAELAPLPQGPDPNSRRIAEREDEYKRRRLAQMISPARNDAFLMGDKTPDASTRTYADIIKANQLAQERQNTLRNIADKQKAEAEEVAADRARPTKASMGAAPQLAPAAAEAEAKASKKRGNRWDQALTGDA